MSRLPVYNLCIYLMRDLFSMSSITVENHIKQHTLQHSLQLTETVSVAHSWFEDLSWDKTGHGCRVSPALPASHTPSPRDDGTQKLTSLHVGSVCPTLCSNEEPCTVGRPLPLPVSWWQLPVKGVYHSRK